jgi:hypothetical protein
MILLAVAHPFFGEKLTRMIFPTNKVEQTDTCTHHTLFDFLFS